MSDNIKREGEFWSATNTLAFLKDPKTGKNLLHQVWINDLGLAEWRVVPLLDSTVAPQRNPSYVGVGDGAEDESS